MLMLYYIVAFNILGPTVVHYYRLTWVFLFGHLAPFYFASGGIGLGVGSYYFESLFMILSFVSAILMLLWASSLNKKYDYKGKSLLFLGGVSYFFYLSHRRIGWVICCDVGSYDMIIWVIITLLVSTILYLLYYRKTAI